MQKVQFFSTIFMSNHIFDILMRIQSEFCFSGDNFDNLQVVCVYLIVFQYSWPGIIHLVEATWGGWTSRGLWGKMSESVFPSSSLGWGSPLEFTQFLFDTLEFNEFSHILTLSPHSFLFF